MTLTNSNLLAYTAGYFDGDGYFYCCEEIDRRTDRKQYRAGIKVTSTNRKILDFFKAKFSGSCSNEMKRKEYPDWKSLFSYHIQGEKAFQLTTKLLSFLVEKREEAEVLLGFMKTKSKEKKLLLISKMHQLKHETNLIKKEHRQQILNQFSKEGTTSEQDFAYLAGFIDAECSFKLNSSKDKRRSNTNPTYKMILDCNNSKLPIFPWLIKKFGGNLYFTSKNEKHKKRRNQLTWRLSSKALSEILPKIYPFLKYKQAVCKKLMEFYETTLSSGGDRHSDRFKQSYAETLLKRADIKSQVHLLNAKGCKKQHRHATNTTVKIRI